LGNGLIRLDRKWAIIISELAQMLRYEGFTGDLAHRREQSRCTDAARDNLPVDHLPALGREVVHGRTTGAIQACSCYPAAVHPNERIAGLYEENAAAWDHQRSRDLFERPWMERFADYLPKGGRLLDVGCGMGEPIARFFVERGFQVAGVDSSPSLIAMCAERFPDQQWMVQDMRALALGSTFDGIVAWHSLFHLSPEDQRPMFPRFEAHLRPGGVLMFTSAGEEGASIGRWQGEPLYHGSLSPEEYRTRLEGIGFEILEHALQDPDCGHATIWLARKRF